MQVKLLHVTPEHVINDAISQPYNQNSSNELTRKVIGVKKHLSCAEHVIMNWNIEGISRLCLQELVRHRIASLTVKSSRYTLKELKQIHKLDVHFVKPEHLNQDKEMWFIDQAIEEIYKHVLKSYSDCFEFCKVNKSLSKLNERFKYAIPEGLRTSLTYSMNLRSFINLLELRTSGDAHFEIRILANKLRESLDNTYVNQLLLDLGF